MPQKQLSGKLDFKYLDRSGNNAGFKNAKAHLKGNYYELDRQDWKLGQLFQLFAETLTSNEYLYVFSIDAKSKKTIHFPRKDTKLKIAHTPLIIHQNSALVIPSEESAMMMNTKGTEYLCALFSTKKIENIQSIVEQLVKRKEDLHHALYQVSVSYTHLTLPTICSV